MTVNNVAPVITSITNSAPKVGDAREGQPITIKGIFTDVGTLDTHTATIDWGDGTTSKALITEKSGSGLLTGSHKYAKGDVYDVKVSLSDDDNGTATQATTALITGAGINGRVLQIVGTSGKDNAEVKVKGKNHEWTEVKAGFLVGKEHERIFRAADFDSIVIMVGDGNDHVTVDKKIVKPVLIDGGADNDHLMAGGGPAVLLGGDGNDVLIGGPGNDVLIGGDGNDAIFGGIGNDLLDGGNGSDLLFGSPGNDILIGGAGNDKLFGGSGNDTLDGGPGNDRLFGGRGNDKISGGEANDLLVGGRGKDTLDGGEVHDKLIDWHGNYGDSFVAGHRAGSARHLCSPSWVREFVLDMGANGQNPNSDICVTIAISANEQPTGLGDRRKGSVG